jgi:hypothetical protein
MQIDDLEWDDRNEAHIARHQVEPEEVEDVCYGNHMATTLCDAVAVDVMRFAGRRMEDVIWLLSSNH